MVLGHEDGHGLHLIGDVKIILVETEQIIRARLAAAQQLIVVEGIDAHFVTLLLQRPDGVLEMREFGIGKAADIDDVGALPAIVLRALDDRFDWQRRCVDDLGEDLNVIFGHIDGFGRAAENTAECLSVHRVHA